MSIKRNDRIIFNSKKSPNDVFCFIKKNAKKDKWSNQLQNDILYKIKKNKFVIYIPWSVERRVFQGIVFEDNEGSTLEGRFLPPRMSCCIHLGFWIITWPIMIFLLQVPDLIRNGYFIILLSGGIIIFLFDVWHLLIYRNKKYEDRIIRFLEKCMEND